MSDSWARTPLERRPVRLAAGDRLERPYYQRRLRLRVAARQSRASVSVYRGVLGISLRDVHAQHNLRDRPARTRRVWRCTRGPSPGPAPSRWSPSRSSASTASLQTNALTGTVRHDMPHRPRVPLLGSEFARHLTFRVVPVLHARTHESARLTSGALCRRSEPDRVGPRYPYGHTAAVHRWRLIRADHELGPQRRAARVADREAGRFPLGSNRPSSGSYLLLIGIPMHEWAASEPGRPAGRDVLAVVLEVRRCAHDFADLELNRVRGLSWSMTPSESTLSWQAISVLPNLPVIVQLMPSEALALRLTVSPSRWPVTFWVSHRPAEGADASHRPRTSRRRDSA